MSISLQNVTVHYGQTAALRECSLEVGPEELLCLVGPSGCGKSTLLKVVAGFVTPVSGTIKIGGQDVSSWPVNERNIAYVMDNLGLYPHLSVFDNIAYPLRIRRFDRRRIHREVTRLCQLTQINGLEKRRPHELSAGQQQRVAIARALVREDVTLLLADESFSNLDVQLGYKLRNEFRSWQRQKHLACIFVTHDQEEALALGDRVALMKDGSIEQIGTAFELYSQPASLFAASFFGRPPCNLVPVVHPDGATTALGRVLLRHAPVLATSTSENRNLVAAFRAEFVHIGIPGQDSVNGIVRRLEPLNPDIIVHVEVENIDVSARLRAPVSFSVGEFVSVSVDPNGWLVFDSRTGTRVSSV